jgi:aldehyde dehydrogenase (NAD+)
MGCTVVLKPSELAPFSAALFADVFDAAGVPPGVFNLVNGDGEGVGSALSAHPDVDMVSFTGSARGGTAVAVAAAPSIKRVHQELGGKSANIILEDADLATAVAASVQGVMLNAGQSCNAPTRLLAPRRLIGEIQALARAAALATTVGNPDSEVVVGPVVSAAHWEKIQRLIQTGIDEGATLLAGGLGRPEGLAVGHYVQPTVFADVTNDMTIAREEIFGPVLCIIGYDTEEEAIEIANDTLYGLQAYIVSGDEARARRIAGRLEAGRVSINSAGHEPLAPFGGFKQSGIGREGGVFGLEAHLEPKSLLGLTLD